MNKFVEKFKFMNDNYISRVTRDCIQLLSAQSQVSSPNGQNRGEQKFTLNLDLESTYFKPGSGWFNTFSKFSHTSLIFRDYNAACNKNICLKIITRHVWPGSLFKDKRPTRVQFMDISGTYSIRHLDLLLDNLCSVLFRIKTHYQVCQYLGSLWNKLGLIICIPTICIAYQPYSYQRLQILIYLVLLLSGLVLQEGVEDEDRIDSLFAEPECEDQVGPDRTGQRWR